jgi:hypothetical protein
MAAGLPAAALQALRKGSRGVRGRVLHMLCFSFKALPNHLESEAVAVLVSGGVVELLVWHMAQGPVDVQCEALSMLINILADPLGKERMFAPRLVEPLLHGISKWLLKVRTDVWRDVESYRLRLG